MVVNIGYACVLFTGCSDTERSVSVPNRNVHLCSSKMVLNGTGVKQIL